MALSGDFLFGKAQWFGNGDQLHDRAGLYLGGAKGSARGPQIGRTEVCWLWLGFRFDDTLH